IWHPARRGKRMDRMANLLVDSRAVRILALASIFGLVACGGPSGGTGEGGSGGAAGKQGTGGSATGGNKGTGGVTGSGGTSTGGSSATGGVSGTGGAAGATATGTGGAAGGTATDGGAAGIDGAAGMDGAAGSGVVDAGVDMPPDGGIGGGCTDNSGCASGFCVDGVCCESACTDLCMACASGKTGAANGLCKPISVGTDPDNECDQQAASTCGTDGMCDGAGACRKYTVTTQCSSETCTGSTDTPAGMCNGSGTCTVPTGTSC